LDWHARAAHAADTQQVRANIVPMNFKDTNNSYAGVQAQQAADTPAAEHAQAFLASVAHAASSSSSLLGAGTSFIHPSIYSRPVAPARYPAVAGSNLSLTDFSRQRHVQSASLESIHAHRVALQQQDEQARDAALRRSLAHTQSHLQQQEEQLHALRTQHANLRGGYEAKEQMLEDQFARERLSFRHSVAVPSATVASSSSPSSPSFHAQSSSQRGGPDEEEGVDDDAEREQGELTGPQAFAAARRGAGADGGGSGPRTFARVSLPATLNKPPRTIHGLPGAAGRAAFSSPQRQQQQQQQQQEEEFDAGMGAAAAFTSHTSPPRPSLLSMRELASPTPAKAAPAAAAAGAGGAASPPPSDRPLSKLQAALAGSMRAREHQPPPSAAREVDPSLARRYATGHQPPHSPPTSRNLARSFKPTPLR
jgi:hypothetical protein